MFVACFKYEEHEPQRIYFKKRNEEPSVMEFKGENKNTVKFKINENFKLSIEN